MVKPTLWGPSLWQTMFACAWTCSGKHVTHLLNLVLRQIPLLLPCEKCRLHFIETSRTATRRAGGEPCTSEDVFRWLYFLKDEVNKLNRQRTPVTLDDVTERHCFHGGIVDDVALGDALVLVALNAHKMERDAIFVDMCQNLARLLPLPSDSELIQKLKCIQEKPIVPATVRAAKAARVERGLSVLTLPHYRTIADES